MEHGHVQNLGEYGNSQVTTYQDLQSCFVGFHEHACKPSTPINLKSAPAAALDKFPFVAE